MDKKSIESFINRYSIGGEVESVTLKVESDKISVKFISDDKTLLGTVVSEIAGFPDGEYSIYTTSQLKSMLGILESSIDVNNKLNAASNEAFIKFSDKSTSINYMLSDSSVIPAVPPMKSMPDFGIDIKIDDDFISKYIKAKSAITSDTFTFRCKDDVAEIILGYSTINTNRVSIEVECKCEDDVEPISFSSNYLKEILAANRGSKSAKLEISTKGLARLSFNTDEIESQYYLVQIK
jgi:hypothetical protein